MSRISRRSFIALSAAAAVEVCLAGSAQSGEKMKYQFKVDSSREAHQQGVPEDVLRIEYTSGVDGLKDWALVRPPKSGDTYVVHVHGHGSTGDQIFTRPDIRDRWLPLYETHNFGILSVNLRGNAWMSPAAAADLHDLLGYVRREHSVKRFLLISGSMGGTSNLIYAGLHPEDVAGVIALCPATDLASYYAWCRKRNEGVTKDIADAIEHAYGAAPEKDRRLFAGHSVPANARKLTMPVFICHGTADPIIPVSQPRKLVGEMGESASFAYVEIPDGDHEAPLACGFDAGFAWLMKKLG